MNDTTTAAADPAQDQRFMQLALSLARRGLGNTWPNPAVGAVLVKDGVIIGRGWTQPGGRPHAETEALKRAGRGKARGATLYTTLEPCAHQSPRGPTCTDLIIAAKPERVVIAVADPDTRTNVLAFIDANQLYLATKDFIAHRLHIAEPPERRQQQERPG